VPADPDFAIPANDVHVWRVPALLSPWQEGLPLISAEEQERAQRFKVDDAARRFVWTRACTRIVLARYLRRDPLALTIATEERGKPHLHDRALEWSVSHGGELGLIAVSRAPVGVDVERVHAVDPKLAARTLSPAERLCFGDAPSSSAFLRCWTRKEAFLKGTGDGLHRPLRDVSVLPAGPGLFAVAGEPSWRVMDIAPDGNHVGAIATLVASPTLRLYEASEFVPRRSTR